MAECIEDLEETGSVQVLAPQIRYFQEIMVWFKPQRQVKFINRLFKVKQMIQSGWHKKGAGRGLGCRRRATQRPLVGWAWAAAAHTSERSWRRGPPRDAVLIIVLIGSTALTIQPIGTQYSCFMVFS